MAASIPYMLIAWEGSPSKPKKFSVVKVKLDYKYINDILQQSYNLYLCFNIYMLRSAWTFQKVLSGKTIYTT